jgi:hypothetical protein
LGKTAYKELGDLVSPAVAPPVPTATMGVTPAVAIVAPTRAVAGVRFASATSCCSTTTTTAAAAAAAAEAATAAATTVRWINPKAATATAAVVGLGRGLLRRRWPAPGTRWRGRRKALEVGDPHSHLRIQSLQK